MAGINIRNEEDGAKVKLRDPQKAGDVPISVQYESKSRGDGGGGGGGRGGGGGGPSQRISSDTTTPPEFPDSVNDLPAGSFEEFVNPQEPDTVLGSEDFSGSEGHEEEEDDGSVREGGAREGREKPSVGYSSIEAEKREILVQLHRLRDKGHLVRQFTMHHSIQDMRTELSKINYGLECKRFSDLALQVIVTSVNLLETGNQMFDPFGLDLDGWGESVDQNRSQLEDPLEELFRKYRNRASIPPELKILIAVGGMGAMVHYRKKWANRAFGSDWDSRGLHSNSGGIPPQQQVSPQPQMPRDPTAPVGPSMPARASSQPSMTGPPFSMPSPHMPVFPTFPNPINTRVASPVEPSEGSSTPKSAFESESGSEFSFHPQSDVSYEKASTKKSKKSTSRKPRKPAPGVMVISNA